MNRRPAAAARAARSARPSGCLLGKGGEHPAQVVQPRPDRRPSGTASSPARPHSQRSTVSGRAVDHDPGVVAGAVFHRHLARRRADRPGQPGLRLTVIVSWPPSAARCSPCSSANCLWPGDRAVGQHPREHLVDAVGREVSRARGDGQAGRQFGVDPVDRPSQGPSCGSRTPPSDRVRTRSSAGWPGPRVRNSARSAP